MRTRDTSARERLLAKLFPQPNGCWHWDGFIDPQGYGRTGYKGRRSTPLHQAVYDCLVGPVPDGLVIDHACHSHSTDCKGGRTCLHRRCGNPDHMELVTPAENSRRAAALVAACPNGHPYEESNTYISGGQRFCRTCMRVRGANYRARLKENAPPKSLKTHCKRGHEFTPENTGTCKSKGNTRICRTCTREGKRRRNAAKPVAA